MAIRTICAALFAAICESFLLPPLHVGPRRQSVVTLAVWKGSGVRIQSFGGIQFRHCQRHVRGITFGIALRDRGRSPGPSDDNGWSNDSQQNDRREEPWAGQRKDLMGFSGKKGEERYERKRESRGSTAMSLRGRTKRAGICVLKCACLRVFFCML